MSPQGEKNKSSQSCCLCVCRVLCCPFRCLSRVAHTLCQREAENYVLSKIKAYFIPIIITLLLATSTGIMIKDGILIAGQATWDASVVIVDTVLSTPTYIAPVVERISNTWNTTYTAVSISGTTVSQNAYNFLAPLINKTSELSGQLQQKYDTLVPYMNQTMVYLRKNDEDKLT